MNTIYLEKSMVLTGCVEGGSLSRCPVLRRNLVLRLAQGAITRSGTEFDSRPPLWYNSEAIPVRVARTASVNTSRIDDTT
jgi:hypothetical protein